MELLNGDLIFLDLRDRPLAKAIADVTQRQFQMKGYPLSHVGVVTFQEGSWKVFESWEEVQLTPLDVFKKKGNHWFHARLMQQWRHLIPKALEALHRRMGKPYDYDYTSDDENYYCSHLVAEAFREANDGKRFFEYKPMYFGNPNDPNDKAWKAWERHFKSRKRAVPVGEPGISPLGIYLSENLERLR